MLYLHCGWPRTGTTSLQSALVKHEELLAAVGILFPDRWRARRNSSHNGLYEMVAPSSDSEGPLKDFERFLADQNGRDVLLSAEAITAWLQTDDTRKSFLRLLATAQDQMPTTCAWTLRRVDALFESMYLFRLERGLDTASPTHFFSDLRRQGFPFNGMHRVEEALNSDVVYVKYEPTGTHNNELLHAFAIPDEIVMAIENELNEGPHRNRRLSQKEAVAFGNLPALSARAGVNLSAHQLRAAFMGDRFRFEDDWPCKVMEEDMRKSVHEWALTAAREHGISSYLEFFEDVDLGASGPVGMDAELISEDDLRRLVDHLRGHAARA